MIEHTEAVKAYVAKAWPVSSLTREGCYRSAWGQSHLPNVGLNEFKAALSHLGWKPVAIGEVYLLRFGNDKAQEIKCEGVN